MYRKMIPLVLLLSWACVDTPVAPTPTPEPTGVQAPAPGAPQKPYGPNFSWAGTHYPDVGDYINESLPWCPAPRDGWTTCRNFTQDEKDYIQGELYAILWMNGCYDEALTLHNAVTNNKMVVAYGDGRVWNPSSPWYMWPLRGNLYRSPGPTGTQDQMAVISFDRVMTDFPGPSTKTIVHEAIHMYHSIIGVLDVNTESFVNDWATICYGA